MIRVVLENSVQEVLPTLFKAGVLLLEDVWHAIVVVSECLNMIQKNKQ